MALSAAVAVGLFVVELPHAYVALQSYQRYAGERLQERPRHDFAVGLRLLPGLRGMPPAQAVRMDFALLDSVDVDAISVVVDPEGVQNAALDSLARTIEDLRRDSVLVIVSLGYRLGSAAVFQRAPARFLQTRLSEVDRVARRLRPDYLLPARDPYTAGTRALGRVPVSWWEEYLRLAARTAHRVDPHIRVGVSIAAFTKQDSALYAWASAPSSPLDVVGFSLFPSYGGGAALAARMRTADHWMRTSRKEHWVFAGGGYPLAHGEQSQARVVWGLLTWGTSHPRIRGVVIESAADYEEITGLRAPSGRTRLALSTLSRAVSAMSESSP
jgi:hypothetical protein